MGQGNGSQAIETVLLPHHGATNRDAECKEGQDAGGEVSCTSSVAPYTERGVGNHGPEESRAQSDGLERSASPGRHTPKS